MGLVKCVRHAEKKGKGNACAKKKTKPVNTQYLL